MDCSLPGTPSMEFSKQEYCSGEQGIFPTQDLKAGLQHCRQILYHLSHQGSCIHIFNYFFKSLRADLNKHFLSKLLTKYFNILKVCVHDPFGQLSNWLVSDQYQLYVWTLTRMITEARAQTLNLGCTSEPHGGPLKMIYSVAHFRNFDIIYGVWPGQWDLFFNLVKFVPKVNNHCPNIFVFLQNGTILRKHKR